MTSLRILVASLALALLGPLTSAADVVRPAEVSGLSVSRSGADLELTWTPVTQDAAGQPETLAHYKVYRGAGPHFPLDFALESSPITAGATHSGAGADGQDHYYLVTAVDAAGNESGARPSSITSAPVLSGSWTDTTIDLDWNDAQPQADVLGYRVYYGTASRTYDAFVDVGPATLHSLGGLALWTNYYTAVTAIDLDGNESAFSNEHVDAVAGRVRVRAHDDDYLCWTGVDTCPADPGEVKKSGWQLMVPVDFPEGDWTRVRVTYTMDSRLCSPPAQGTASKCGQGNPNGGAGGWNPCGDPWDRLAHLFLVLDDCIENGSTCITQDNLELIRAITPFGTDAPPPDGTGVIGPRALTLDVTPFAPLLSGTRYVGAEIVNFTEAGWHVTVDFEFSERPDEASPDPPADGIQVVGFGGAPLPTRPVSIPPTASQVFMRVFTTGHGGVGNPPCDEFCQKIVQLKANGVIRWATTPWRTDCSPSGNECFNWNACGYPSCTFSRAGWCPGYIACHHNAPCDQDINLSSSLLPGNTYNLLFEVRSPTPGGSWPSSVVIYWYE